MANFIPNGRTENGTPLDIAISVTIPEDSLCRVMLYCFAASSAGQVAIFTFRVAARRIGADAVQMVVTKDKQNTAGATLWDANPIVQGDQIVMRVQGAVDTVINWLYANDDAFCMVEAFAP